MNLGNDTIYKFNRLRFCDGTTIQEIPRPTAHIQGDKYAACDMPNWKLFFDLEIGDIVICSMSGEEQLGVVSQLWYWSPGSGAHIQVRSYFSRNVIAGTDHWHCDLVERPGTDKLGSRLYSDRQWEECFEHHANLPPKLLKPNETSDQ
jgi:hypothetical protein